ncbi:nitroreductase family protein [Pseudonocardia asaccharolytica]|uniref:Oxidoreductase n=1 Tax=Pseudonocardia asaccharolytica DSM 44247 = NBRC 16224 TaxID=1123024 RepID=A0A511CZ01_9PSEU|nr:nitroreductase family protein [Pseudonocardia asaccharolytica]GEL16484.1 oxidoreductase [Pseudonocardia asaccharolytica DSM 44247 = NBRC 16224]
MTELLPLNPDELLTTTRSVRKRLDLERPVPLEVIRECLEVALQAPTGSNAQSWHWIVVTDPGLKKAIAGYYAQSFDAYRRSASYSGARRFDDPARDATQTRVASSADHLAAHMAEVPVLVIGAIFVGLQLPAGNQAGLWGSLLPAAWSFQLAARARGLGSAWTTLHLEYEKEIAELLGIPARVRQGVLLPVAYTKGTDFKPAPRQSLDAVLHLNSWSPVSA